MAEGNDPFAALEQAASRQRQQEEALRALTRARARLVLGRDARSAFFATLALRLRLGVDWEQPTMSTDGTSLDCNPSFVLGLSEAELLGVLAHEVLHNALCHHARRGHRDPERWNAACDAAVNPLLLDAGFTLPATRLMPGEGSYADLPRGRSAEEYYELLCPPPQPTPEPRSGEDQQGQDEQEEGQQAPGQDQQGGHDPGGQQQGQQQGDGDQDAEGQDPGGQQQGQGQGSCHGSGAGGDPGGCGAVRDPGDGSRSAARHSEAEWQVALAEARQVAGLRGELPAGLARAAEEVLRPAVDWREALRQFVSVQARNDFSWSRPNRRLLHRGLYLPGLHSQELGLVVLAVDTSGSIGPRQLGRFAAEVEGILEAFSCALVVLYHDCEVQGEQRWQPGDGPLKLQPVGGGGTSHACVFSWLEAQQEEPACVVCLTDLYTSFPDKEPLVPTLWAVVGTCPTQPPFGLRVDLGDCP